MTEFWTWAASTDGVSTIFVYLFLILITSIFVKAHLRGDLDWKDMITHPRSNKVSLTKVLQFIGGFVATWVIIKSTVLTAGKIDWELFTAYLAYVGSIDAYSKYLSSKYNSGEAPLTPPEAPKAKKAAADAADDDK